MQIVIDISEDDYRKVQDGRASVSMMRKAIRNGTPLPKGHGRLIDADEISYNHAISRNIEDGHNWNELVATKDEITDLPTIIEADKEGADNE